MEANRGLREQSILLAIFFDIVNRRHFTLSDLLDGPQRCQRFYDRHPKGQFKLSNVPLDCMLPFCKGLADHRAVPCPHGALRPSDAPAVKQFVQL